MTDTAGGEPDWATQYRGEWSRYDAFRARLQDLIRTMIESAGIDVIQIEARTKRVDSFTEKINRKGASYSDPMTEVTDLVGLRVITYYSEDVSIVGDLIGQEFSVDDRFSIDKSTSLEPDRFGYSSVHYVVRLSETRRDLPEWKTFAKLAAEIQVRTALQHAWAAVSHKLDYKSAEVIPPNIRRRLFRLSAMFEVADEQLSQLRLESEETHKRYAMELRKGDLDIPLDSSSLSAYWTVSPRREEIISLARRLGATLVLLPTREFDSNRFQRDREDLVTALRHYGFTTLQSFDDFLTPGDDLAEWLRVAVAVDDEGGTLDDLVTLALMVAKGTDEEFFRSIYTAETWQLFKVARGAIAD